MKSAGIWRPSCLAVVYLVATAAAGSAQKSAVTLLILPFDNASGNRELDPLQRGFPELVAAALEESSEVHVVDRTHLDQLLSEQGLKWENLTSEKPAFQIGRLAQAQYILRGSFLGGSPGPVVRALLYDTATTRLLKTFQGSSAKALSKKAVAIGHEAGSYLASVPAQEGLNADADPETSNHLILGMSYFRQRQFEKAIPEFIQILAKGPNADAQYWLIQSYEDGGLHAHASLEAEQFLKVFPNDKRSLKIRELLHE